MVEEAESGLTAPVTVADDDRHFLSIPYRQAPEATLTHRQVPKTPNTCANVSRSHCPSPLPVPSSLHHQPPHSERATNQFPFVLPAPLTPFASSQRSRLYQSAVYFGECRLLGVSATDAEEAARAAAEKHRRWWINRKARRQRKGIRMGLKASLDASPMELDNQSDNEDGEDAEGDGDGDLDGGRTKRRRRHVLKGKRRIKREQENSLGLKTEDILKSLTPLSHMSVSDQQMGVAEAKVDLLRIISQSGGFFDVSKRASVTALDRLVGLYHKKGVDARQNISREEASCRKDINIMDGTWLSLCRPEYESCRGHNASGEFLYRLGRMSFDMFRPVGLICSVRGVFSAVTPVEENGPEYIPQSLKGKLRGNDRGGGSGEMCNLRTYK